MRRRDYPLDKVEQEVIGNVKLKVSKILKRRINVQLISNDKKIVHQDRFYKYETEPNKI